MKQQKYVTAFILDKGNGSIEEKDLRQQLEKARKDPNYSIVTTYGFHVQEFSLPEAKAKKG
jgi:hypothetical protein